MSTTEPPDDLALPQPRDREAARLARRLKRQFPEDDTAPEQLRSSAVAHPYWPTRSQHTRWWMYIDPTLGVMDDGWWYAKCPLHDEQAEGEVSAQINFKHGMLRCLKGDDSECHSGKRGITLSNVIALQADRVSREVNDVEAKSV